MCIYGAEQQENEDLLIEVAHVYAKKPYML